MRQVAGQVQGGVLMPLMEDHCRTEGRIHTVFETLSAFCHCKKCINYVGMGGRDLQLSKLREKEVGGDGQEFIEII